MSVPMSSPTKREASLYLKELEGSHPLFKLKSTAVMCGDTNFLFLFGGFDEMDNLDSNVYLLNMETMEWEVDDKHKGIYREGHSAVYIGNGNVLVFGGVPHDEFPEAHTILHPGSDSMSKKDSLLIIYSIFDRKWIGPPSFALENIPSSRSRHACCLSPDGSKIYISGGLVNSMPLDDLYYYDLALGTWSEPIRFAARFDHHITIFENKLYSFGGLDKDMNHITNKITFFNIVDFSSGEVCILQEPNNSLGKDKVIQEIGTTVEEIEINRSKIHSYYDHFYIDSRIDNAIILDICLPLLQKNTNEMSISTFNLNNFQISHLLDTNLINEYFRKYAERDIGRYMWKVSFVSPSGSLYLLGNSIDGNNERVTETDLNGGFQVATEYQDTSDEFMEEAVEGANLADHETANDFKLSHLLMVKLSEFGVTNIQSDRSQSSSFIESFRDVLIKEEFTDYEITTFDSEETKDTLTDVFELNQVEDQKYLRSIKVHKSILLARWPHFQRVMYSGMNESISNKMFVPEPLNWVKGLVFYLYTGTIQFEKSFIPHYSMSDYSGLLILSNLYELNDLRYLVLKVIYEFLNDSKTVQERDSECYMNILIRLWKHLFIANEESCILKVTNLIKEHWDSIINSSAFKHLPKHLIIKLCQECSSKPIRYRKRKRTLPDDPYLKHAVENSDTTTEKDSSSRKFKSSSPFLREYSPEKESLVEISENFPTLQFLSSTGNDDSQGINNSS